MNNQSRDFIRLILRSPDIGEGWRKVSDPLWKLVEAFAHQELLEKQDSAEGKKVRLSPDGIVVARYL